MWEPRFGSQECLLGQKLNFKRRKPFSRCYSPQDHEVITKKRKIQFSPLLQVVQVVGICACTNDDYECDFCFARNETDGECYFICVDDQEAINRLPPEPTQCELMYTPTETYGYRRVEDNKCNPDAKDAVPEPSAKIPCGLPRHGGSPSNDGGGGINPVVIVVVMFVLLIILMGGLLIWWKTKGENRKYIRAILTSFDFNR